MNSDTAGPSRLQQIAGTLATNASAAGGLLAALGVASCCALPIALSVLGIGAASLAGIGFLAAPYQRELLLAATLCLVAFVFMSVRRWRQRSTGSCTIARTRTQVVFGWLGLAAIATSVALIALTFWIEPPL